eukprot:1156803-Pelagomonas_calceolata.AAC.2
MPEHCGDREGSFLKGKPRDVTERIAFRKYTGKSCVCRGVITLNSLVNFAQALFSMLRHAVENSNTSHSQVLEPSASSSLQIPILALSGL